MLQWCVKTQNMENPREDLRQSVIAPPKWCLFTTNKCKQCAHIRGNQNILQDTKKKKLWDMPRQSEQSCCQRRYQPLTMFKSGGGGGGADDGARGGIQTPPDKTTWKRPVPPFSVLNASQSHSHFQHHRQQLFFGWREELVTCCVLTSTKGCLALLTGQAASDMEASLSPSLCDSWNFWRLLFQRPALADNF